MGLFALLCGMVRDQARPDCHQSCHQDSGSMKEGPGLLETSALSGLTNTEKLGVTYLLLCFLYQVPELMLNFLIKALRSPPAQVGVSIGAHSLCHILSHKHTVGHTLAG